MTGLLTRPHKRHAPSSISHIGKAPKTDLAPKTALVNAAVGSFVSIRHRKNHLKHAVKRPDDKSSGVISNVAKTLNPGSCIFRLQIDSVRYGGTRGGEPRCAHSLDSPLLYS